MEQWQIWTLVAVIGAAVIGVAVWLLFFNKDDDEERAPSPTVFIPTVNTPSSGGGSSTGGLQPWETLVGSMTRESREGCIGAFGLRYLVPEYNGPVVRIQASQSSSTAKDFKPSGNGGLVSDDGQSLEDYIGGRGIAFVKILYDQSINFGNTNKPPNNMHAESVGASLPVIQKSTYINLSGEEVQDGWAIELRTGNRLQSNMIIQSDLDQVAIYAKARRGKGGGGSGRIVSMNNNTVGISINDNKWAANFGAASFSTSIVTGAVHDNKTDPMDRILMNSKKWNPVNSGVTDVSLYVNTSDYSNKTSNQANVPTPVNKGGVTFGGDGGVVAQISEVVIFRTHMQSGDLGTVMSK